MKLNSLKELVKEELKRALNEVKVKVKIDYITEDPEGGGPGIDGSTVEQVDQDEFDKYKNDLMNNFWKGIAKDAANDRIYKIDKITKL
jgi:hypothetical protein